MNWLLTALAWIISVLCIWWIARGVDTYDDDLVETFAGHPCHLAGCDGQLHPIGGGCDLTDYRCDGFGGHGHRAHVIRAQDGPLEVLLHREPDLDRPPPTATLNLNLVGYDRYDRDVQAAIDGLCKARRDNPVRQILADERARSRDFHSTVRRLERERRDGGPGGAA